ncbi:unnamed protein product [Cylindrotheca closterium]|uniref:ubiquitinyl hydrolase 1 n=1 Tax=Cylindrotheca closterium TaxID=2856 RepID=A0AAD2JLK1_9STRA|nr:unnamed protein product [Cylindrotheca closterium]
MGITLLSWLGESRGLWQHQVSEGMIRLLCNVKVSNSPPSTDIRYWTERTGVTFPNLGNFSIEWESSSPFETQHRDSPNLFTEKFYPNWPSKLDDNTDFTMRVFLVANSGENEESSRENIAPSRPELKPNWLTVEQYNAFASIRAAGRTQIRSLLNVLFEELLPLGNPCSHILIRQTVFQIGACDWKTDLQPEWNGMGAMELFWCREVNKLREAQKLYENLLLTGVISGFYGQYHTPLEEVAIQSSEIFEQWAEALKLETQSVDLIAKQACFLGFAILCLASVNMTFPHRSKLLRFLVLYNDRLLLSQEKADNVLQQAVMKVMGTKWTSGDRDFTTNRDLLLTSLVQAVVESAPSDLEWSEVHYDSAESTACFEAVVGGRLFSINLNNGIVLVNGKPKSFLPQSITSDSFYVRHFGKASPEVSVEGLRHYRTTRKMKEHFFYDFVSDADDRLHIFEFDSRKGFHNSEKLELLDRGSVSLQPHLVELHSHWLNARQQYLLLRDILVESHQVSYAMKPGKLLSIPPSFQFASIQEIDENEERFDEVLIDRFGVIKYSLPRYGLNFTQVDDGIRSDDFKGYIMTPEQQLSDTLPGFNTFLLLSNDEGEEIVIVPCGEVLQSGEIRNLGNWDTNMTFHVFHTHRRFCYLQSSNTLGRLHLACLYASSGSLVPDRRTGKTGFTVATELLRQCFQNFCFSDEELAKLRNLSRHSHHSSALRLLIWHIYRGSLSLRVPYKRTPEQEEFLDLDKLASEEYRTSFSGPYLTSVEEQSVFCRVLKGPIEAFNESKTSVEESDTAKYIKRIEMGDFQPLLSYEKRNGTLQFPLTNSFEGHATLGGQVPKGQLKRFEAQFSNGACIGESELPPTDSGEDHEESKGTTICEQVFLDLRTSYRIYADLSVKNVVGGIVVFSEISEIGREVLFRRESIERRLLGELNSALCSRRRFDFFFRSMCKFVSSDLLQMIYSKSSLRRIQPSENGFSWVQRIKSQIIDWALLCVFEDKLRRLERFSRQRKIEELIQELECTRIWDPKQYPRWLAFEVEQQLQIRPEQFKTVDQLLTESTGSVIQLNMGSGKTRVMVPMLILELCRQQRKLARINVLPSILQEALLFYQQSLVASVQHTKIFTLPFIRDFDIDEFSVKILDEEMRRCYMHGGCLIVTPQHRNSLLLKQHDCNVSLKADLSKTLIVDVLDESDAILEPSFQLVYAMGTKLDLPSRSNRCTMFQSLLTILSRGECQALLGLLTDSTAFYKQDSKSGNFNGIRILKLSREDKNFLASKIAEHFVRNPPSDFPWLETMKQRQDIELLVRLISDPEFQNTSIVIRDTPLFNLFENDILAARGFLAHGILLHSLQSRWGVSYGLRHLHDYDTQMAVPYSASDTPKARAEFSHPDVAIAYTNLSYLYLGLTKQQFRRALDLLDAKGLSVKLSTYDTWIEKVRLDIPTNELDRFDTYGKVDTSNHAQFELMHHRLNRCMEVVFFWLNEVVFPVETMQYPQRRISSAWNLADTDHVKQIIGFSGTDDNRFLLPYQVKQIQHADKELCATNGKMIDLVLSCTQKVHQVVMGNSAIWEIILDDCFQLKVQALIDTGGLMAGSKRDSVVRHVAMKLKNERCVFKGFVYYSTDKERWEVFEIATGRTQSITRSTLSACDCFVYFDESRCRGTDFKLLRDSSALVTLDKRLTKDKFLQGCARMRQLFPGGQSLILGGTTEVVTKKSTTLDILNMIVENGIKSVERALPVYVQRAKDFISFPRPANDNFELNEMYSKSIVQNQSFHEYLDSDGEVVSTESAFLQDVTEYARSIGKEVEVAATSGAEECEKEVHSESEQDEEREVAVTSQSPRSQEDWDYWLLFNEPQRLFLSHFHQLSDLIEEYGVTEMNAIQWSKKIFCTPNFWETIEKAKECSGVSPFLRLVDPLVIFPDGRVVLISLYELNNLLPLWWGLSDKPNVSIDHVFQLSCDCPSLGQWSLPVSIETLVSLKLFRGDVKFGLEEEKVILRQMLHDLERPVDSMKQLVSTRNRLSRYEKSDLSDIAYLLSLPPI